jgi:hypothetical protein
VRWPTFSTAPERLIWARKVFRGSFPATRSPRSRRRLNHSLVEWLAATDLISSLAHVRDGEAYLSACAEAELVAALSFAKSHGDRTFCSILGKEGIGEGGRAQQMFRQSLRTGSATESLAGFLGWAGKISRRTEPAPPMSDWSRTLRFESRAPDSGRGLADDSLDYPLVVATNESGPRYLGRYGRCPFATRIHGVGIRDDNRHISRVIRRSIALAIPAQKTCKSWTSDEAGVTHDREW